MEVAKMLKIIIELYLFIVCLIQRLFNLYYLRAVSILSMFSKNWLEIPLSDKKRKSVETEEYWEQEQPLTKPKFIKVLVSSEECNKDNNLFEVNNNHFTNGAINETASLVKPPHDKNWGNSREMTFSTLNVNARSTNSYTTDPKTKISRKKSYMSNATIKLAEYDSVNRSHISQGDFQFTFTHPSASNILSKFYLNSSSYTVFKNSRSSKRKMPPFKPTELSTIFENLAY